MYYPIWLAYATGVLEQDGFHVRLLDAPADNRDLPYVLEICEQDQPDLVVIDTSTPSIFNDIQVAEAIRTRIPTSFIVLVGPHVSALPEISLSISPAVNAVARGEYDYTLRDVARALRDGKNLTDVSGISYQDMNRRVYHNPDRPLIQDLDELPFVSEVYKRHLTIANYFYSITQYKEVAILTGRGCPYHCSYCVWPQTMTGHGYRKRSVENVAAEFEFIDRELPEVKEVFIEDDTLTVDPKRSAALAHELIRRGNRLAFSINSRADVSYETLAQLHRAGMRLVCVGFESGDQQVLDRIQKRIKVEQFYRFRDAARKADVLVHGCFMAGNPGDTPETLQKTLRLAMDLNPDTAQFFPIMIYPGTAAYEWARQSGYMLTENFAQWLTAEGHHRAIINQPGLSAEQIVAWCDSARRSFYLRPRYFYNKVVEMARRPQEIHRVLKASRTFFRYLFRPSDPKS
jgi:radical SAM superfamily enzyme YgiQ (UPF0313 family)